MSTLSAQVLRLLDRINSWSAQQTFLGGRVPLVAEGTITHAQILLLRSSFITGVAAPGAGKVIVPRYMRLVVDTTHGAYTNRITAGGVNAWFGPSVGSIGYTSLFDDTTLLANVTAGVPLPDNVLPGYNPASFSNTFGQVKQAIITLESVYYRDYSNRWGLIDYDYDAASAVNQPLLWKMGHDGTAGELTGGGTGNSIGWYLEYNIVTLP